MLKLTSSDKNVRNTVPLLSAIIADLTLCAFAGVHLCPCIVLHGYLSLSKISGLTTKVTGSEVLI